MKLIDLLNKIANNEEVPKKVKINNEPFDYDEKLKMYYTLEKDEYFGLFPLLFYNLNDEVEIIEEEKKMPEKIKIDDEDRIQALSTGNFVYKVNQPTKNIIYKINEIIDYIKSKEK